MPDIALLRPTVLRGVVQKFTFPPDNFGARMLPRTPYPFPTWEYDVVKGGRNLALPNVPNAEANIVKQQSVGKVSGSFIYVREKKVFEPTTLHWLRTPGTFAERNAEATVARELQDLNNRMERFIEWTIWQMFSGTLTLNKNGVVATIDYLIAAAHKPTAGTLWSNLATASPEADLRTWKRLITRDAGTTATRAIGNEVTVGYLTQNEKIRNVLFSDRMRDQMMATGEFTGFLSLTISTYDLGYVDDAGVEQRFLPDGKLLLIGEANRPTEMLEGPSADDDAPSGFTGKFSKSWKQPDPSARQILVEYNFMPTLQRPEQVVYANVA